MTQTIGWIGVGSMGHRMSRHLVTAGHALVVADAVSTERAPQGASAGWAPPKPPKAKKGL